ncbi:MAG: hypothetical protein SGI91_09675 [Alphaproteobacteria bacterium]|jgi:hypothetical protein|nr:hypothetical protein [Alphaproteobacteria bacterium]
MIRIVCIAVSLALAAPVIAAEPAEPVTNPTMLIDSVTAEGVAEIVREIGGQNVQIAQVDKSNVVTFSDAGIPYNLGIVQCDVRPGKCVGLIMVVVMEGGQISLETINTRNKSDVFLSVAKFDDTKTGIGRALLVDSGVTKKNIAMNISAFAGAVQLAIKTLNQQVVASTGQQQYLRAASAAPFRPALLPPHEAARIIAAFDKPYATRLLGRR